MAWWFLALAVAAPPAGLDLGETAAWERGADALLDGPPGCWEVVGRAHWNWDVGVFGESRGDAIFVGRLEDGVWTGIHVEPLGELRREGPRDDLDRIYDPERRFAPLLGKLQKRSTEEDAEPESPVNYLRDFLAELSDQVEITYAEWDEDKGGVRLVRTVGLQGRGQRQAKLETHFPGGGLVATEVEVTFPDSFTLGKVPPVTVSDAVVRLRGRVADGVAFPRAEAFRVQFGVLGISMKGAQTLIYDHFAQCAG